MPKYRVLTESFIDNHRRMPGEVIEFDGLPAENLEPLDDAGKAKAADAKVVRKEHIDRIVRELQPITGVDPTQFASAIVKALAAVQAGDAVPQAKGKKAAETPLV